MLVIIISDWLSGTQHLCRLLFGAPIESNEKKKYFNAFPNKPLFIRVYNTVF